jgi:hypothetical protein
MQRLPSPYTAEPMEEEDIQITETKIRSGDLGRMVLDAANAQEEIDYPAPLEARAQLRKESAESSGRTVNTLIYSQADTSLPKVFFDHDSYLKDFEPLFAGHFSESTFLWGFQGFHADLIRRSQVDLIVDEFVERSLIGPKPRHEWPLIQEYWAEHFETCTPAFQLENLSFKSLIPELQKLKIPEGQLPILKISSQPEQTDKLVIDYGDEQGYYWLRPEGDVYYLEYDPQEVKNFRVEKNTPCMIDVEVSLY